ncbi:MAG: hypothetical protein ACHQUB_03235 [Candidatus Saccharimonadia bacterium]
MTDTKQLRLHLGCGQVHLDGYVNIDFPTSEHTVQEKSVADEFADITKLSYKPGSVSEVRLHHTYEHFIRSIACALLASWYSWLCEGGIVHVEVPDFTRTALSVLSPLSSEQTKAVGLRHIFGSNEAAWAVHYEGWSLPRLTKLLELFGFELTESKRNSWHGTFNIEVIAKKTATKLSKKDLEEKARQYLKEFLLDDSELPLLAVWMQQYREQIDQTWAK